MDSLFDTLDRDWDHLATRRTTRRSYTLWAQQHPSLAAHADPAALILSLRVERDPQSADLVLAPLAALAACDPLAGRTLLQAILPGLRAIGARHAWLAPTDELEAVIVSTAWEHIRRYPLDTRPRRIAANLLLDTAHHVRADLRQPDDTIPLDHDVEERPASPASVRSDRRLADVIRRALKDGYLTHDEAWLILRSRVLNQSIGYIAAELGYPPDTIRHRRRRAETSLRAVAHSTPPAQQSERPRAS